MISETVISEFRTQRVTVAATAARLGAVGLPKLYSGVFIKALSTNTNAVFVGMDDQVTAANGFELSKDESIHIPIDAIDKVWAIVASGTETVCLLFS